ncbi:MAG: hypothetical protein ACUVUE_02805 [Candidatus Bathycorpusculaceae bacterium]
MESKPQAEQKWLLTRNENKKKKLENISDRGNTMIEGISQIPLATVTIILISIIISTVNTLINRLLVSRFVGWEEYKTMQKEIAEYRSQTTLAMRTKDKKLMEKLKKKESQILNMQKKMAKPQLILFALSFSYIFVWWFVLTPLYGVNVVAYVPGIGSINVFWWYFICSMLFGTLSSRLLGVMPIE